MEEQEGIEVTEPSRSQPTDQSIEEPPLPPEAGAVIGALEMTACSQPAGSPLIPLSAPAPQEAEEAPVFDHAATPGPASDRGGNEPSVVYELRSIEQSRQGEEREGEELEQSMEELLLPEGEAVGVEIGALETVDYSQPTGSPSTAAPKEDEEPPIFDHGVTLGITVASSDRGGEEASDVCRAQSIEQGSQTEEASATVCEEQEGNSMVADHGAHEMDASEEEEGRKPVAFEPSPAHEIDDRQLLDSSAASHSNPEDEGKEDAAFVAAPAHEMDAPPFLGSSAAQSASALEDAEAATFEASATATAPSVASDKSSEEKAASILKCKEGEGGTIAAGVVAQEIDDSQLLGFLSAPASASSEEDEEAPILEPSSPGGFTIASDDDAVGEDEVQMDVDVSELMVDDARTSRVGRRGRKRGRPPMVQLTRAPTKRRKEKEKDTKEKKGKEDEELCFICFDGGDLVVCDRKGCPKVYHPSCVNRDEAFFRAKGRWNCGWHICSSCEKSAQFMCYTCTFSLCKGCISEAGFVRVRGNKGFCVTCMSTVLLIESNDGGIKKLDGIDFDDKSSWMSFFKDYWLGLKGKLSLTLEELTRARTPSKESTAISRIESSEDLHKVNDDREASSDSSSGRLKGSIRSRKKAKKRLRNISNEEGSVRAVEMLESEGTSTSGGEVDWASKELLEFVAHMKDGDRSALSQYDVQALLLDYIKRNSLRDPRKKSHIICDSRLQNLFGKIRVGHFEMLKLLESHFLTKEPSPVVTDDNQEGVVDPEPTHMDTEGNSDASTMMPSDRRRKSRKRVQEKEPQTNLDDYASIDAHNINLIYLRRNLMEDLIDDIDTFGEKVVGSFVRIRISGAGQRQDIYRLVQVIGTGNTTKSYRTGKKTTDFTLEISNLNKTEFITIDIISNQEFTEEECKRLRQSIKCGFISRLTVGEVQEKARVLQAVRVNDWLESEKLRLGNLRDRASEKGRRKELRECVEKLQLLGTPEERIRRLHEVPEIHADPKMDPDYESSEDEGEPDNRKQDNSVYQRESSFRRKGTDGISPGKSDYVSSNNWNSGRTNASSVWDPASSNMSGSEAPKAQANEAVLEAGASNNSQPIVNSGQSSTVISETPLASLPTPSTSETEKMWHYQDPSAKVQGPFSVTQLRKWNKSGYFPANLRIWRASERPENSILLSDALDGKYEKVLPQLDPKPQDSNRNDASSSSTGNNGLARTDMWAAQPAACSTPRSEVVMNTNEGRLGIRQGQPQGHNSSRPVAPFSGNSFRPPSYQGGGGRGRFAGRWNERQNNWNPNNPRGPHPGGQGPNWSSSSQQSSAGHWNNQPAKNPPNQWRGDSNNLSTPQPSIVGWTGAQVALNSIASPSTASIQPMSSGWGPTPTAATGFHIAALTTNSAAGWGSNSLSGGNSFPTAFVSMPSPANTAVTPNSIQIPVTPNSIQIPANTALTPNSLPGSGHFQMPIEQKMPSQPDAQAILGPDPTPSQNERQDPAAASANRESCTKLEAASSEAHQPSVQHHDVAEIKAEGAPGTSELVSAPGSERTSDGSSANPAREPTRSPKPSPGLSGPVPSPVPTTRPSKWDAGADSTSGNNRTAHLVSPNSFQLPASANIGLGVVPQHPSTGAGQAQGSTNMIRGLEIAPPSNSGLVVVPQNPSTGAGPVQGNSNMVWGATMQGAANVGWGVAPQGGTNAVWGIPAQGNPHLNVGWGTPVQAQANTNLSTGWGAPVQGDTIVNMAWGTPAQGTPTQGQGNPNPNLASGAPMPGITNQNINWGVGQGNMNPTWNPSGTNPNLPIAQQNQIGDSGQGGGWQSSGPPPRGGGPSNGVCWFHESGHCKKGAYCNYVHL